MALLFLTWKLPRQITALFLYAYVYPGVNTSTPCFDAEMHCMFMNILCEGDKNQILE